MIGHCDIYPEAAPQYFDTKFLFKLSPRRQPYTTKRRFSSLGPLFKGQRSGHEEALTTQRLAVVTAELTRSTSMPEAMDRGSARSPPPLRSLLPAPAGGVRKEIVEKHKPTRVNACEACRTRKSKASAY